MSQAGGYGERLRRAVDRHGPLCVGIDPHPGILRDWGLTADASGLERCARTMIEAVAGQVALVKPQSAFFETYGSAGIAVLERVLADARTAGLITLLDVKRGDIGSTMDAYAAAYLADGAPLAADAITLSPYLGAAALDGAVTLARQNGRGVYLLAATSNPEADSVQRAITPDGRSISQSIIDAADVRNHDGTDRAADDDRGWGDVGLVVGATIDPGLGLELDGFTGTVLAPGFGAQGGTAAGLTAIFGAGYDRVLPSSSREMMAAGPQPAEIRARVQATQHQLSR